MGCEPCLLLDLHVLNHQFKTVETFEASPKKSFLEFFKQFRMLVSSVNFKKREREREEGHVIQCSELMSAVLQRKPISSDESDKKYQDSNLYLEM